MLWSVRLVQPSESFAITQAGHLCVEKVIFPSLPSPFFLFRFSILVCFSLPSPKKKTPQEIPCVERVDQKVKPIWQ